MPSVLALRLSLVGPGRAGKALARSWIEAGGTLGEILGRNYREAERAALELGGGNALPPGRAPTPCDMIVLAVPDDAVSQVAASLAGTVSCAFAFHLSGALVSAALAPLSSGGASLGSLHPLRAFTGASGETWRGAYVAVEGEPRAVETGLALAGAVGARGRLLPSSGKTLYHAGAQLAAGGTVAVISLAARAWEAGGLDLEEARAELARLAAGAAAAAAERPFAEAFTGAVARRDVGTIRSHLEALAGQPEVAALYARLALETLARTAGRGREEEVRRLLLPVLQ